MPKRSHAGASRQGLLEKLKPFSAQSGDLNGQPRDVPTRVCKAGDQTCHYRVGDICHDNGDCFGSILAAMFAAPPVKMTSTLRRANSAVRCGSRSTTPSA